jgi:hypothetical protein
MAHTLLDPPRPIIPFGHYPRDADRPGRFERARAVLEDARSLIERGWLQHGWYLVERPPPRSLLARMRQVDHTPGIDDVRQACLVAAVAVAAHGGGRPDVLADAGPAVDLLWDALWEDRGQAGPAAGGRAAAPPVRIARMRELVRWNDVAGRTREEVLGLLDRAISRCILAAVSSPS